MTDRDDPDGPGDPDDPARAFERRIAERYPGLEVVPSESPTLAAGPSDRSAHATDPTPIEAFYVLNHYPTPAIDADSWRVSLTGAVERTGLSVTELREEYPTTTVTHTMECAGNGRSHFASVDGEPERYVQWDHEGAGTARWTGTPLSAVLEANGAETSEGAWLTAIGGDAPDDPDADVFARSLPMWKVLDDCLLADRMNGDPLPPEHGFPVRVVVPGWYGVNSVKWVAELRVAEGMMAGAAWARHTRWQQDSYRLIFGDEEPPERADLPTFDTRAQIATDGVENPYTYDQHVMSLITHPDDGATVAPGSEGTIEVRGVAWAGDDRVASVEVSPDGGDRWHAARLVGAAPGPTVRRRFRCELDLPAGEHDLVSRATDDRGRRQPARISDPGTPPDAIDDDAYPWNREGYANNAYRGYGVTITVAPDGGRGGAR